MRLPLLSRPVLALAFIVSTVTLVSARQPSLAGWGWTEINGDAPWARRAGLQVVELANRLYLMGGRTPVPSPIPGASIIWDDVWTSADNGVSWTPIVAPGQPGHWPARAYFQAVTKGPYMYVLGGQNFRIGPQGFPVSDFFNDVWRSRDGVAWQPMASSSARWSGRAGLSAAVLGDHIYVMGGSVNDDSAIGGGGPARIYYNDVWRSRDGVDWERMTPHAAWAPRAGAVVVSRSGYLYLLGGEDGFLCDPARPDRCPPYYNDVWRSRDGATWELVTDSAGWSPRPGHQCVVVTAQFVCFGGFGLPASPFDPPANPMDVWVSQDGAFWEQISDAPWNATTPEDIKYDFDALVVNTWRGPSILTFGGDRETFNFTDPTNYLRVDNDVWGFAAPRPR
jgi:hypothetical protein